MPEEPQIYLLWHSTVLDAMHKVLPDEPLGLLDVFGYCFSVSGVEGEGRGHERDIA